jgi:hypothetical protein
MRTTFVALLGLCAASLAVACDDDKKPTETAPSATVSAAAAATPPPPPPKPTLSELIPKTIKAAVDAWNAHDPAKVVANYEPTGKLVIPGLPEITGKDGLAADAKADFAAYSDFKVAVTRIFIKGSTAAYEWVVTGKNDGPLMGQKPSGRQVGIAGVSVATFDDDGLMKQEHRYFDLPTVLSQVDPKAKAGTFRAPVALPAGAAETHVAKGTPGEAKNLDTAKAIYAGFEKKGGMDMLAFVTDDSAFDDYTMPATMKGPKPIKDWVAMYWTAFPTDLAETLPVQFAADDFVISEGIGTGTQKGALGPFKPSNKPATLHFVDIYRIKDGKAAHLDSYSNSAEMLVAIGAMPPIAPPPAASASAAPSAAPAPSAKAK